MNNRKLYFLVALLVTIVVLTLLMTGSSLLNVNLVNYSSIPLGTFITWAGMMSLPLSVYWGIRRLRKPDSSLTRLLSFLLKIIIAMGILWVPISYLLAGNLSFSFSETHTFQGGQTAMRWFWGLSYSIGGGTILVPIIYWISLLFKKNEKKSMH